MAAVSLHPLASRSGAQSATVVSLQLPGCDPEATPTLHSSEGAGMATSGQDYHFQDSHDSSLGQDDAPHYYADNVNQHETNHDEQQQQHGLFHDYEEDEEDDEDGQYEYQAAHTWTEADQGPEWGLHHQDIEQYPSLLADDESEHDNGAPPIRTMTAKHFAELQRRYAELDIPHSVVFPFLHGVDGDNAAQNAFFRAPPKGMPTPFYRGLTVLRADMPTQEQQHAMNRRRASSSASKMSLQGSGQRSRADSLATTESNFSTDSTSSSSDDEHSHKHHSHASQGQRNRHMMPSQSTTSISSSAACSEHSRTSSLFSRAMSSDTAASSTYLDSDTYKAAEAAAYHARASRVRNSKILRRMPPYDAQPNHSFLNSTVMPNDIIEPPLMANLTTSVLEVAQQSGLPSDDYCFINRATFVRPKQADGISLRNFKTQCAMYATISDIVIYCPTGLHEGVLTMAKWVQQAQEGCFRERMRRGLGGLRYNVFVVIDSFDVFEREQPHLIAIDAGGFSRNRVDFIEREREEMQRFTEATEIDDNVWMGCTANVPYALDEYDHQGSSVSLDSYLPEEVNPNAFSICIEAIEQAEMPATAQMSHASHFLDAVEATAVFELNSQEALRELEEEDDNDINNAGEEERPSLGPSGWSPSQRGGKRSSYRNSNGASKQPLLYPSPSNITHFKALGSGSQFEDEMEMEEAIENIVNMCIWIKKQACPAVKPSSSHSSHSILHGALRYGRNHAVSKHQQQLPRRVLLHCSDGYTDTSIMGLAYLIFSRQLSLPEAYLDLQNRCNRCFFVYARDVPFLQRLSVRLVAESKSIQAINEKTRSGFRSGGGSNSSSTTNNEDGVVKKSHSSRRYSNDGGDGAEQSVWARGLAAATGLVTSNQAGHPNAKRSNTSLRVAAAAEMARTTTPTPQKRASISSQSATPSPQPEGGKIKDHSWFTSQYFQGSFPSKILPFLYLGNLNHAMNPAMLHAIGITHVVSVGESALLPPNDRDHLVAAAVAAQYGVQLENTDKEPTADTPSRKTLWEEEQQGRISVLDLKNVSDDGIDSLRPHMNKAIEYIEQARLQGGKVLVHCRVGVSRSATICIAYAMAHCDLSMIESFLLVRSRRMNVLTQPTLLFVWEMRGFEAQLARLKEERRQRSLRRRESLADDSSMNVDADSHDDGFSFSALSISSGSSNGHTPLSAKNQLESSRNCDDLAVEIGAGAGSVYGFQVKDYHTRPFNSGSSTRLSYYSAKLTHGYFCKLLSELNARYMVT